MNKPNLPKCLLGLFFCAYLFCIAATAQRHKTVTVTDTMRVLKIYPTVKTDTVIKVIFLNSQRIYKLPVKANAVYLQRLKISLNKHVPVPVQRASEQSDVILRVGRARKK